LLTDSSGNPAYSVEYDVYNGKITNQWNPYNLTNLLFQHGETGAFSLPLGMSQSIIGDDYIVPLHSHNSTIGRIALGLDPILIPWPPAEKHNWDKIDLDYDPSQYFHSQKRDWSRIDNVFNAWYSNDDIDCEAQLEQCCRDAESSYVACTSGCTSFPDPFSIVACYATCTGIWFGTLVFCRIRYIICKKSKSKNAIKQVTTKDYSIKMYINYQSITTRHGFCCLSSYS
jgi:hypothetical protein